LEKEISNNDKFSKNYPNEINNEDAYNFELILDPKHFDPNTTNIISDSKNQLDNIINLLLKYPKVTANIKAYSNDSNNIQLSQNRANKVKQYLMDNGIPESQLTAAGVNRMDVKLEEKIRLIMIVPMPIHFQFNSDKIDLQEHEGLDKVSDLMNTYPKMRMEVHSHADSRSSFWYNKKLSVERMRSTIAYLTDKGKINWRRIRGKAYGERKLYNDCADDVPCTEDQHQKNRRSEFIISK